MRSWSGRTHSIVGAACDRPGLTSLVTTTGSVASAGPCDLIFEDFLFTSGTAPAAPGGSWQPGRTTSSGRPSRLRGRQMGVASGPSAARVERVAYRARAAHGLSGARASNLRRREGVLTPSRRYSSRRLIGRPSGLRAQEPRTLEPPRAQRAWYPCRTPGPSAHMSWLRPGSHPPTAASAIICSSVNSRILTQKSRVRDFFIPLT